MPNSTEDAKRQLWIERFAQFQKSKLTVTQFCQYVKCSVPTFYLWRRKLSTPSCSDARSQTSAFLEVQTKAIAPIRLELPSGVIVVVPYEAIDALPRILEQVA